MPTILIYIIIFTLLGSVVSLAGGIILLFKEQLAIRLSHFLAAFAAGALLGTAFFDLLPEALEKAAGTNIFFWALVGMLIFFLLERGLHWFHHHHREHPGEEDVKPTVPLIIIGDSIHNFIDGVVIAATFLVDIRLGIITSLAVAAHEIPQEIGDFGILLHKGMRRKKVLLVNLLSAVVAIAGALLAFFIGGSITEVLPILLSITAGFFIYIAASDLIPEIHYKNAKGLAFYEILLLLLGVGTIWVFVALFE